MRYSIRLFPLGLVPVPPVKYVLCSCIASYDELLFPAAAVVSDAPQFLRVSSGSSESYGRYAEVTVSFSQLSPHMYVILTVAVSLE
jgi:hypothetical protein